MMRSRAVASARAKRAIGDLLALHLAEDVLGQQLLEIHRRLDFTDLAVRGNDLLGPARADPYVLFPDQPLRLDRRDRVFLKLDPGLDAKRDAGLVVRQADRLDAADLDPRDLHGRPGLQAPHRREIDGHRIAAAAETRDVPGL